MAELHHSKQFYINPLMVDFNKRLFPAELFRMMQITASEHVGLLGYDEYEMSSRGYAWVLMRSDVKITEYPVLEDTFEVFTATCEPRHGVYPRYFEFRKEDGTVIGTAYTIWIIFDMNKRAMVSATESDINVPGEITEIKKSDYPGAVRVLQDGTVSLSNRTVVYSDLDMVGHMNNTRYIDWLSDAFAPEKYRNAFISHILINYIGETPAGETLELELKESGNAFSFRDLAAPKAHFAISGEWSEIRKD